MEHFEAKKYEAWQMEIVKLDTEDVITASTSVDGEDNLGGWNNGW